MPNTDCPRGFKPYGKEYPTHKYPHATSDSTAVYPGDAVKTTAGYCTTASAGGNLRGVAKNYVAASSSDDVIVYDHPDHKFVCQDDASITITQAEIGGNCDILATTGDTTLKLSKQELAVSTNTSCATTTAQIRLLGVAPTINPDGTVNAIGDNCDLICQINEHELNQTTGT